MERNMKNQVAKPIHEDHAQRILFAWPGMTGYMGACWRALQKHGAAVRVVSAIPSARDASRSFNPESCYRGVDVRQVPKDDSFDHDTVFALVREFSPDVLFVTGWSIPVNRFIATHPGLASIPKVFQLDMPWQFRLRKFVARFILRRYLRIFAATYVSGESSARYARWLGFGGDRPIYKGLYATDLKRFAEQTSGRDLSSFLYVGRYAHEKGIDVLADAYAIYCNSVEHPWPLDCVGAGAKGRIFHQIASECPAGGVVRDLGFKQPDELTAIYASHGTFILPSRFEPWGVVLAEAAGAGLPIICTDACGARKEVVRDGIDGNGFIVHAGCAKSLARAMIRMHHLEASVRERMGTQSRLLSTPYSADAWAERTKLIANGLIRQ